MKDILQLLISGVANGCVYGLIALGFVLIYKATEAVNFAQGDFMMLGAFITLGLTNADYMGLPFWISCLFSIAIMGILGYLLDFFVLRRLFGQSLFRAFRRRFCRCRGCFGHGQVHGFPATAPG